jgi:phage internal scaffolding protein
MARVVSERSNGRKRVISKAEGESRTEQHHANAVNINQIVSRYQKTGVLPEPRPGARYGDFASVEDYHSAVQACRDAEELFMSLPPELRKRFDNDPHILFEFLENEENRSEAEELGLIERKLPAGRRGPTEQQEPAGDVLPPDPDPDPTQE